MIAVVQRVNEASVRVEADGYQASIERGTCVLLAIETDDDDDRASWMARKIAHLRIFPDDEGLMNRSLLDIGGEVLLISQFTLVGDVTKGHRPSFVGAAEQESGRLFYGRVAEHLRKTHGLSVRTGVFGAEMVLSVVNDGPVTLVVRRGSETNRS